MRDPTGPPHDTPADPGIPDAQEIPLARDLTDCVLWHSRSDRLGGLAEVEELGKHLADSIGEPLTPELVDTPEREGLATGLIERERHRPSEQRWTLTQAHLTLYPPPP